VPYPSLFLALYLSRSKAHGLRDFRLGTDSISTILIYAPTWGCLILHLFGGSFYTDIKPRRTKKEQREEALL